MKQLIYPRFIYHAYYVVVGEHGEPTEHHNRSIGLESFPSTQGLYKLVCETDVVILVNAHFSYFRSWTVCCVVPYALTITGLP